MCIILFCLALAKMSFLYESGQSNSTRQTLKKAEGVILKLYDLQNRAQNSDKQADSAEDLIKDLNQQVLSILKVTNCNI